MCSDEGITMRTKRIPPLFRSEEKIHNVGSRWAKFSKTTIVRVWNIQTFGWMNLYTELFVHLLSSKILFHRFTVRSIKNWLTSKHLCISTWPEFYFNLRRLNISLNIEIFLHPSITQLTTPFNFIHLIEFLIQFPISCISAFVYTFQSARIHNNA